MGSEKSTETVVRNEAQALPTRRPVLVHMPVDVRSASLAVLAVLASVFALRWASAVFIPVMLGLMFSYALSPAVDRLARWRVPRAAGAALLMTAILGGIGATGYSLSDDAVSLIESLPEAATKLRQSLHEAHGVNAGPIEKVQRAAAQLEQAAQESTVGSPAAGRGVTRVQIERAGFNVQDYLWTGTLGFLGFAGQVAVVCLITFFLVISGDSFRRKVVKIAGPTFSKKKITVQAMDEITWQVQRYLLVQLFTSTLVGVFTWLAFLWIGLEHAAVWGIAAGLMNCIPYLGSMVLTGAASLVGFLQFGTLQMAMLVGGASLLIHSVESNLLTPLLISRASRMNPVAIFVGVLAWGWLWGIPGLLLGVPIMMVIKSVCDRVDDLKPIGELLGD